MPKLEAIELVRVQYIPKELKPGLLYVSEEFGAAVHLCACGCGWKVSTPLDPMEWKLKETASGPTLLPSIGNWQYPCQSHYWIRGGRIVWADKWTPEQIASGRRAEEERRRAYYDDRAREGAGFWTRLWNWIKSLFQ